jgi:hypothetical protein
MPKLKKVSLPVCWDDPNIKRLFDIGLLASNNPEDFVKLDEDDLACLESKPFVFQKVVKGADTGSHKGAYENKIWKPTVLYEVDENCAKFVALFAPDFLRAAEIQVLLDLASHAIPACKAEPEQTLRSRSLSRNFGIWHRSHPKPYVAKQTIDP